MIREDVVERVRIGVESPSYGITFADGHFTGREMEHRIAAGNLVVTIQTAAGFDIKAREVGVVLKTWIDGEDVRVRWRFHDTAVAALIHDLLDHGIVLHLDWAGSFRFKDKRASHFQLYEFNLRLASDNLCWIDPD